MLLFDMVLSLAMHIHGFCCETYCSEVEFVGRKALYVDVVAFTVRL
jgi:hypothetical protein